MFGIIGGDWTETTATATVSHPGTLTVGEPFDLIVTITDPAATTLSNINNIDFFGDIPQHFELNATDPKLERGDKFGLSDYVELWLSQELPVGGSADITFNLTPLKAGEFDSTLSVYFDEYIGSSEAEVTLSVQSPDAATSP